MSDMAVQVRNLSKLYRFGLRREDSLSESFHNKLEGWFRRKSKQPKSKGCTGEFWALKDVSFDVECGEVIGIIGHNGAGKSTLLKILSRITKPTSGRVELHGRVGSLLEVGTGFHPELTGRDNIYLSGAILGMRNAEIARKFDEIVQFSGVEKFVDTPVKRYSSGMYVRLAFAVAASLEPDILIVDEVLAVGDAAFQKKCLGKIGSVAKEGRTVLFVSHNMGAVRNLCSRAIYLDQGQTKLSGSVEEVLRAYGNREETDGPVTASSLAERVERTGSGTVRVTSFRAQAIGGGTLEVGAPAEFLFGYASAEPRPIAKLYIGMKVSDAMGATAFACSTAMVEADLYNAHHIGKVVCHVAALPLVPGKYWVDLKLVDNHGLTDYVSYASSFEVVDGGAGFRRYASTEWAGSVVVPHTWTVE